MKFDLSSVEFSNKDIKEKITIPKSMNPKLAYLIGVHIGDGSMNIYKQVDYLITYTGHLIDEQHFHKDIISYLFKDLFNKKTNITFDRRKNNSSLRTYFRSRAILTFFHNTLGLPLGPKNTIDIPDAIKNSNKGIKRNFLKGLADTDFSLTFKKKHKKKHYYPVLDCSIKSKRLYNYVVKLLEELNFDLHIKSDVVKYRDGKASLGNIININGVRGLELRMKEIGFNSSKHLTKYNIWKKFGFCPPNTNIIERQKILKREIDINSFQGPVA